MVGQARPGGGRAGGGDRARPRRPPARLDATSVRVIAQSVPSAVGGGVLREDVAAALAADAEVALRRVVSRARAFMRHARRDNLTAEDVAAALRLRGAPAAAAGAAPLAPLAPAVQAVGHVVRGAGCGVAPRFEAVDGAPGLFVMPQPMLDLKEVVLAPAARRAPPMELRADWLAFNGTAAAAVRRKSSASCLGDEIASTLELSLGGSGRPRGPAESHVAKRPRAVMESLDAIFAKTRRVLAAVSDSSPSPLELELLLRHLSSIVSVHALLPGLLSLYHTLVIAEAQPYGSTARMIAATRMLRALVANPHYGFEAYVHTALPSLLTAVAGRALGDGDHLALRTVAAETLRDVIEFHGTPVVLARTTKTLTTVLNAESSALHAVHGAVLGLTALGANTVRTALLPNVPCLLQGLRKVTSAVAEAEAEIVATTSDCGGKGAAGNAECAAEAGLIATNRADATALADAVMNALDMLNSVHRDSGEAQAAGAARSVGAGAGGGDGGGGVELSTVIF